MVNEESMKAEASMFESSEMSATFLASTPLVEEAWKLCSHAKAAPQSFVVNHVDDVTYFAFSGVQACNLTNVVVSSCGDESSGGMVALESGGNGIFSALRRDVEGGKEVVMVHGGFLNHFLSFYNNPSFQNEMIAIMNRSKSIIFTGHSLGGTMASLSALWLLSHFQTVSSPLAVLCITFGSPMLGNESLSRAILEERWGGNFFNVVAQDDIVPSLLLAPLGPLTQELHYLFNFWHLSMVSSPYSSSLATQLSDEKKTEVFYTVLASLMSLSGGNEHEGGRFWPFGSYMFCTSNGAICLDHGMAILKMLYVILFKGSPRSSIENHLKYENFIGVVHWQFLKRRSFSENNLAESNYDAGVALALQSTGVNSHESISGMAKDSLEISKQSRRRNLNSTKFTVELYNTKTLRVQVEWYKAFCDESDDQMGYYDSFKLRGASRRETKVNLNRLKLASFWNNVIKMLETNQLPYDFHKQGRWVNASQFYKLLVEPLEIAEYYRNGMHQKKGHYLENGREKRYKIFDKWWSDREVDNEKNIIRNEFASLTQDTCFWARVEEAKDWLNLVRTEIDTRKQCVLLEKIDKFEQYAKELIEKKEVSKDVLAKNSSYSLFVKEWRELKSHLQLFRPQVPGFLDGKPINPIVFI